MTFRIESIISFTCALLILCGECSMAASAQERRVDPASALTPEESLKRFQLPDNMKIELVAAEPQVIDPVAIAFDDRKRIWVVEMRDYPHGPAPESPPLSRIRILTDKDRDGRYETSQTFADQLLFATGLQLWKQGAIVTLAGKVIFLEDTNNDGRADRQEVWFEGFAEQNPQLRVNHPTFAFDHQVYLANGLRGGTVKRVAQRWNRPESKESTNEQKPLSLSGRDFRFDPLTGEYDTLTGMGQFGLTFDRWGNRFVCSNRNPCKQIVLEDRYMKRNPLHVFKETSWDVAAAGENSKIFPISQFWTTSNLHEGQFTAACGVDIESGSALPSEYQDNIFTCDPTGNLVHREIRKPFGATFRSKPAREGIEFLASDDIWFRPVNITSGPDGALYIVDMYRAVIEHPQFMPAELKKRPDLLLGNGRGRIWRLLPKQRELPEKRSQKERELQSLTTHSMGTLASEYVCRLLEHPFSWQRRTASRLLYERQDQSVTDQLREMLEQSSVPEARIAALWTLDGLKNLRLSDIQNALQSEHPRLKEHALRLAEPYLKSDERLRQQVVDTLDENDIKLSFQVILSCGEFPDQELSTDFCRRVFPLLNESDDPWIRRAALTWKAPHRTRILNTTAYWKEFQSVSENMMLFWEEILATEMKQLRSRYDQFKRINTTLIGLETIQDQTLRTKMEWGALGGLQKGLKSERQSLDKVFTEFAKSERRIGIWKKTLARHRKILEDVRRPAKDRLRSLNIIEGDSSEETASLFLRLVENDPQTEVRIALLNALGSKQSVKLTKRILNRIQSETPIMQRAMIDWLLGDVSRTKELLTGLKAKEIPLTLLNPTQTRRLTTHRDKAIQQTSKLLFSTSIIKDRSKLISEYSAALRTTGHREKGQQLFLKHCASCHQIAGKGVKVGPDISDSRTKTPAFLLTNILDPNRSIDNNYIGYSIVTKDGRSHTGIISSETATSVTLKQPDNKVVGVLRSDIDEMRSTGLSLMPVGMEKNITPEEMNDLIHYIKNWRYEAGNAPTVP